MANEGTIAVDVRAPEPWPPVKRIYIGDTRAPDVLIQMHARPPGVMEFTISEPGKPAATIFSCPIVFTGHGLFRMALAWKGFQMTAAAGGQLIATNEAGTKIASSVNIHLRSQLPPRPNDIEAPLWEWTPGPPDPDKMPGA